tara:strand:- start:379 stop:810 length:432 start_codon:yes stop_codon:yes gene_type:complete
MKKEIKINIDDKLYLVEIIIDEDLEIRSVKVDEELIDIKAINSISTEDKNKHQISTEINTVDHLVQSSTTQSVDNDIIAPMAGIVLKIEKNIGDEVASGDLLIVMESMKMEQMIVSESKGTVNEISVNLNDQVSAGQLMMKIN